MTQTLRSHASTGVDQARRLSLDPIATPERLLLGPGPSNAHPDVLAAMARPPVGHLDHVFLHLMEEVQDLLRYAWQTENRLTIPVSATGSAAWETCIANTVERGDTFLVAVNGYFGHRMADMASRYGARVITMEKPMGQAFTLAEIEANLAEHKPKVFGLIHAETSAGVLQPMDGVGEACRRHGTLLLLDTVTSLGGVPVFVDRWGVDMSYSCSQKCLSCPPGLGPVTIGPRAEERIASRSGKVPNWYLDVALLSKYWGSDRVYHHTAPVNMNYGLREALRLLAEEGLEAAWQRHRRNAELLWEGLQSLDLKLAVEEPLRLPTLTTVYIPEGVDGKAFARALLDEEGVEIGGGLGDFAGKVWRIGLMGQNSSVESVERLIGLLGKRLPAVA